MKKLLVLALLFAHQVAFAQSSANNSAGLSYSYAELRFVDVDTNGGDGFRINGSWEADPNWLLVGGLTILDFNNNVDLTTLEIGGGYVWHYTGEFDLLATARLVRTDVDAPGFSDDDTGFAISAGTRGLLTPQFEIRGSVNHINLDNSDTYLELAGDYYFSNRISAGLSLEFAGDDDVWTVGARWYFR